MKVISSLGHAVMPQEANPELFAFLRREAPDLVFNIAEGSGDDGRESQVPAILDFLGIPYTFSGVLASAMTLNKGFCKKILLQDGILTPDFAILNSEDELETVRLKLPLFLKPVHEGSSIGISRESLVFTREALCKRFRHLKRRFRQPVLVEEYVDGREFTIGVVGNLKPVIMMMEVSFERCQSPNGRFYTRSLKDVDTHLPTYTSPPRLPVHIRKRVETLALRVFRALNLRDVCRIDVRMDRENRVYVLDVNPLPGLTPEYSDLPKMAEAYGFDYLWLISSIMDAAVNRYGLGKRRARLAVRR